MNIDRIDQSPPHSDAIASPRALSADQLLVSRAKSGDRSAFDALVRKYRHRVMQVCRRHVRNLADVEDAVQLTLMKAYLGLAKFRGDAEFYSWLHRIAINTAMTLGSRQAQRENSFLVNAGRETLSEVFLPAVLDTPEGLAVAEETHQLLWRAITALCEEQRATLVLRELYGMSYSEVADAMCCPVGTVRSRVSRARESVEAHVKRMHVCRPVCAGVPIHRKENSPAIAETPWEL
jgi:RNA polymerase sigma-70 factor (ECF subfamily)